MTDLSHIRNFSIIAHIDHGKSTLADRFIQICGGLSEREMAAQVLDSMDLERERGITIKAQSVTLDYHAADGQVYELNFIDTPGHVDFSYEVSRSLAACEGALLVVDAAQGVEAQSVANCYTAIEQGLEVLPVLNKIDLPAADPDRVIREIEEIIGIEAHDATRVSAKSGIGVPDLLEQLVTRIPPPAGSADAPLQALIVDSWFDSYVGVISLVRVFNGVLKVKDKIQVMSTGRSYQVDKVGVFTPKRFDRTELGPGEVGFLISGVKEIDGAPVGDTITHADRRTDKALPGFKEKVYRTITNELMGCGYGCREYDYVTHINDMCSLIVSAQIFFRSPEPHDPFPLTRKQKWIIESIFIRAYSTKVNNIVWQAVVSDPKIQELMFSEELIELALKSLLHDLASRLKK